MNYIYTCIDPLEKRIQYEYSKYEGKSFIHKWNSFREKFITSNNKYIPEFYSDSINNLNYNINNIRNIKTSELLSLLLVKSSSIDKISPDIWLWVNWIIKRFELKKRIYTNYSIVENKVIVLGEYRELDLYLTFSELLINLYKNYNHLPSLNSLIKCLDIIICYANELNNRELARLSYCLRKERILVNKLEVDYRNILKENKRLVNNSKDDLEIFKKDSKKRLKDLGNILFIATDTTRSRGYSQALLHYNFTIDHSLVICSDSKLKKLGKSQEPPKPSFLNLNNIFVPDLRLPLDESIGKISKNNKIINSGTINCKFVEEYIKNIKPNLILYSGFGGEIVSKDLIGFGVPILHLHAGILPDFRGSTTIYYSLLKTGKCGVSAIFLSSQIDEGNIVKCKEYIPPSANCEFDYEFDSIIRSDLLIDVLSDYYNNSCKLSSKEQANDYGDTYYVIHPLLKHFSLLPFD